MKIKRYFMEDWLNESFRVECNLAASGCHDFHLGELLNFCGTDISEFEDLFLGDNTTQGTPRFRRAICESYTRPTPDNILVTNGSSEALFIFFNQVLEQGDEVVIPFPAFQCLYQVPLAIGCDLRYLDLLEGESGNMNGGTMNIDELGRRVTRDTRLLIINNPHNPMGWTLGADELREIARIARANDSMLLFDEHYRYLPLQGGTELIPSGYDVCKEIHDQTFATGSMIKCFGMVGIRIGWLIGDPGFLDRCRDYKDYLTHTIPSLTDHVARIALENRDKIIGLQKSRILPNLAALNTFMEGNRDVFDYVPPTGGVVCFPALKKNIDAGVFCRELKENHGVSLLPGFTFEKEGYFRLNFGVRTETFRTALDRIGQYIHDKNIK